MESKCKLLHFFLLSFPTMESLSSEYVFLVGTLCYPNNNVCSLSFLYSVRWKNLNNLIITWLWTDSCTQKNKLPRPNRSSGGVKQACAHMYIHISIYNCLAGWLCIHCEVSIVVRRLLREQERHRQAFVISNFNNSQHRVERLYVLAALGTHNSFAQTHTHIRNTCTP